MVFSLRVVRLYDVSVIRNANRRYCADLGAALQVVAATLRKREIREDQNEKQDDQPTMQVASAH
jgi:hypothetical protein